MSLDVLQCRIVPGTGAAFYIVALVFLPRLTAQPRNALSGPALTVPAGFTIERVASAYPLTLARAVMCG